LPGLDGEDHIVDRTDLARIVGGGRHARSHVKVAVDALDVEAVGSHGVEVGTPSDEADVVTGRGQPPAEVPADPPGTPDSDPRSSGHHDSSLARRHAARPFLACYVDRSGPSPRPDDGRQGGRRQEGPKQRVRCADSDRALTGRAVHGRRARVAVP
jgi:hypothetical protein